MWKRIALVLVAMLLAAFALASEPALGQTLDPPGEIIDSGITAAG